MSAELKDLLIATHVKAPLEHFVMGGAYDDELIRTAEGWRIEVRRLTIQWTTGSVSVLGNMGSASESAGDGH